MKISLLLGGAVGYVLGARAGRARYDQIVRVARRISGSQTVQSTAGVLQAQVDALGQRAKESVTAHLHGSSAPPVASVNGANGYHP